MRPSRTTSPGRTGKQADPDEPLQGQPRLRPSCRNAGHGRRVRPGPTSATIRPCYAQRRDYGRAGLEAVQPCDTGNAP